MDADLQMQGLKSIIKVEAPVEGLELLHQDVRQVCDWLFEEKRKRSIQESRLRIRVAYKKCRRRVKYLENKIKERDKALIEIENKTDRIVADIKKSYGIKVIA
ncbi:hypothetical protein EHQ12_04120 [Leptospira gomenensis]|uniref:Uncharacterized protein n=2 Tax=Leptospira gomenensis TaxID=2484974 RepID=A0A5F1YH07_9LEPT|nr:hypothetical protein [Leptospira gomenensis]TGK36199.1 hypothetical protein EHQ17_04600 [Leptospira gomenensis]TGK42763.1 hypothetical protein EHQ07_13900 [Leptospira gomenensis]TGK42951.1 hypothetical protein EHQ12_04120 [Leptospira gomenensis]TGK54962.1 hypothetical protein EHQ13_18375 [Leptospira gomenensis]